MNANGKNANTSSTLHLNARDGAAVGLTLSTTWVKTSAFFILGLVSFLLLPELVGGPVPASETSCDTNGWCKSDGFDMFWAQALVAPNYDKAALWSHIINFGFCAAIAFLSTLSPFWSHGKKIHAGQDSLLLVSVCLFAVGFNSMVKIIAKRQRPCFYYGAQAGSEGV